MDLRDLEANRQPNLIALCTVMLSLATVAVSLRCWSVFIPTTHKFGLDDFLAILTLPFIIAESALIYWWISLGLGRHASILPAANLLQGPKIIFAAAFLYDACISLPKYSVLFFYYRIFVKTNHRFYVALWVVGGLNTAWLVAAWLSTMFQCVPVQKAWSPVESGHCFPQWGWFLGTALTSMMIDLCILIMPLPMLWGLHTTKSRKIMVTGVFLCGYCVIVVSIGRLITLAQAGAGFETDLTWSTITYIGWVQCEGPVSVISVSLPNIFNLGKHVHKHGMRSVFRGGSSPMETPYHPDSVNCNNKFVRMDTYPQHKRGALQGSAVEWNRELETEPSRNLLSAQRSADTQYVC